MATWQCLVLFTALRSVTGLTEASFLSETTTPRDTMKKPCMKAHPPSIRNARTTRVHSDELYVSCKPTYVMVSPQRSQYLRCQPSGRAWQNFTGSCDKLVTMCGDIPPIRHATVRLWLSPFGFGQAYNVTCDPGYVMTPEGASSWLQCQANRWQLQVRCGRYHQ
ncbi:hypothetical protein V1264_002388 [Littorina saxatilis]|uniref:Sushi domain-containing protein n=1 Tax=Littorina saxatilis TaxID=31220 RepID=A0AAN9C3B3_9CAEN